MAGAENCFYAIALIHFFGPADKDLFWHEINLYFQTSNDHLHQQQESTDSLIGFSKQKILYLPQNSPAKQSFFFFGGGGYTVFSLTICDSVIPSTF